MQPISRRATIASLTLVVVAVAGMVLATPVTAVRVSAEGNHTLACVRASPGTPVTLTFTHSMYGGDVTEIWATTRRGLDRQQILTDNAAAAEYYAWDGRVERAGERFEVATEPLHEPALLVRVDQIGRHRLSIGSRQFILADLVDQTAQVTIEPVSAPIWQGSPC